MDKNKLEYMITIIEKNQSIGMRDLKQLVIHEFNNDSSMYLSHVSALFDFNIIMLGNKMKLVLTHNYKQNIRIMRSYFLKHKPNIN